MKNNKLPEGLWPVMLTPFNMDKSLDQEGLQKLTEFYIQAGADGLFANCLSSEMFQLTAEERLSVIRTVISATAGKAPVIATGTFSLDVAENVDFVKKVYDTGVAAVVVNTNQLTAPDDSEGIFKRQLETLIEATPEIPLGLYECPVPYKRLLSPSLMQWIAETGRFLYHKDTSCELGIIEHKLVAVQGTSLGLYNAHVPTGLKSIFKGAAGLSPIGANLYPELFSFLLKNYGDASKGELVLKVNQFLTDVDPFIHRSYPLVAKRFLRMRGIAIGETTRTAADPVTDEDDRKLKELLTTFEQLAAEIGQPLMLNQGI